MARPKLWKLNPMDFTKMTPARNEKIAAAPADKLPEADKEPVKAAIEKLKATVKNGTTEQIKADMDELQKVFDDIEASGAVEIRAKQVDSVKYLITYKVEETKDDK